MEDNNLNNEIYSNRVRAGKRTYFFDVRATRGGDHYLTITESKKKFKDDDDGGFYFEKHKLFLYKEDFEKFTDALTDTLNHIKEGLPEKPEQEDSVQAAESSTTESKPVEANSDLSWE